MTDLTFKGLSETDAQVLLYVAEMLEHGFAPRIINVTPDMVKEEWEMYHVDSPPYTDDEAWAIARRADQELEYNHHFLDGVHEEMTGAVSSILRDRADA